MQEVDIILEGGTILTMDEADTIIPSGAVAIRNDTIVAVGPRSDIAGRYRRPDRHRGDKPCHHARSCQCAHPCGHDLFPGDRR